MKKFIILIGALLFAAVFMSGCVAETEDPIVGIWHYDQDIKTPEGFTFDSSHYVFNADGTGFFLFTYAGEMVSGMFDFTWENVGDGKYITTAADRKGTDIPSSQEAVLEGDTLTITLPDFTEVCHREPLAKFVQGLWITDITHYKDYQDIKSMIYFAGDGTGELVVYSSEVLGMADVFPSEFTWEEKDGIISLTGEKGNTVYLTYENGQLFMDGEKAYHKYTVEDHLYGLWMSDKPHVKDGVSYDIIELIKADGTGVEIWTVPDSHVASEKYAFTWKMTSSHTYEAVYDDGEIWEFAVQGGLQLYDSETRYSKVGFDVLQEYADKVNA